MATGDVRILDSAGNNVVPTYPQTGTLRFATQHGNTALNPGEPCKIDGTNGIPYVVIVADADGTTGSHFVGIVKSKDTVTASVNGYVDVYIPLPGIIYAAKAKTSTNVATDTLITALIGKRVIWDVTSATVTVDTGATDAVTNCLYIVGGDSTARDVYFMYNLQGVHGLGSIL